MFRCTQDSCLFMYEILRLITVALWPVPVNEILKQQQSKSIEQWFYLFQVLKVAYNISTSIFQKNIIVITLTTGQGTGKICSL